MRQRTEGPRRPGVTLVWTAVLIPVLLGMAAFAIDMGYIVLVKGQLQNAADAAALAGVSQLAPFQLKAVGALPQELATLQLPAIQAARGKARQFAALNRAGGVSVTIPANRNVDIVVGHQFGPGQGVQNTPPNLLNAVQVTVRRDAIANTPLPLFFARAIGVFHWSGTATATARLQGNVTGFRPVPGINGSLLPIAVDYGFWTTFLTTGRATDALRHDGFTVTLSDSSSPANVTSDPDGIFEYTDAYPNLLSPGHFGLVSIGPDATSVPPYRTWIDHSSSPEDLQWLNDHGRFPVSPASPKTWTAGPGLKSNLVTNLNGAIGQPRVVPLFAGLDTNGDYRVVGFAGVTIVNAIARGTNIELTFQPTIVIDPTAVNAPATGPEAIVGGSSFVYSPGYLALTQ